MIVFSKLKLFAVYRATNANEVMNNRKFLIYGWIFRLLIIDILLLVFFAIFTVLGSRQF